MAFVDTEPPTDADPTERYKRSDITELLEAAAALSLDERYDNLLDESLEEQIPYVLPT